MKLAALVLLVCAAPLGGCGAAPAPPAAEESEFASSTDEAMPAPVGGEAVLPREADGHFYAEVSIDGAAVRMLVDSGASVVALTGADADALGIAWSPDEVGPVARGAGGEVLGVPVTLDRVQVGDLEAGGVRAVVVPSLPVSLLGQSFLGQVGRIEVTGDQMILGG